MKKVTWKQKSIKKCVAWILAFALVLPLMPLEVFADTETQLETLDPTLQQISLCNFVDPYTSDVRMKDGIYSSVSGTGFAGWPIYGTYLNNTEGNFTEKVINMDIAFNSGEASVFFGGTGIWEGLCLMHRNGKDDLEFSVRADNGNTIVSSFNISPNRGNHTDLVNKEFNFKLSFEVEGEQLKLGVWINDVLCNNTYTYISNYGNYTKGWIHGNIPNGSEVTLKSCRNKLDQTLKKITYRDLVLATGGVEDGKYSGQYPFGLAVGSYAGKVLNGDVEFGTGKGWLRFSGIDQWGFAKNIALGRENESTPDEVLTFVLNEDRYTLTSEIAGVDLAHNEFNLKISFQEEDTDGNNSNDRLKVGVWIENQLYDNTYFYLTGEYKSYLSAVFGVWTFTEGSYIKLTSSKEREKEGTFITETNTGDMNRVPYNNDEITADLGVGCASYIVVVDKNKDGYMDLMVGSNAVPFGGTHVFYGSEESQNSNSANYMLMEKGRKITDLSNTFNATYLYDENGNYEKTLLHGPMAIENDAKVPSWAISDAAEYPTVTALARRLQMSWPSEIEGDSSSGFNPLRQNLADFDGDGKLDFITSWGCWDEYSEEEETTGANVSGDKFDSNGVWGDDNGDRIGDDDGDGDDDPLHAWIVWNKNTSESSELSTAMTYSDEAQLVYVYNYEVDEEGKKVAIESSKHPLDVYGGGYPQLYDWDNDGDLDIICASFRSEITYFENIGSSTNPIYVEGRAIPLVGGGELELDGSMPSLTSFDWNNDGFMDMICGEEDGRVSLVQHSGKFDENNTPIMYAQTFFQTPADSLKDGVLNTPYSVDWDGDGDEDIISGNSSGYISFIKNLSIEKNRPLTDPAWDNPVPLTNPDGEVYRFVAGYNGSIQGPAEAKWGYTQVSVADWDGDGVLDIMSNNISGRVFWHRGVKDQPYMVEDARPVEVEWENGPLYPIWNWWKPEGNELVTQWRTTPYMIDVPLDEDGDGVAEGDGLVDLVIMDHEGYLTFFQRYRDTDGTLKLKEGQRIFKAADGTSALRFSANAEGKSGKIAYLLADYDMDGDLDIVRSNSVNAGVFENIATTPGTYIFQETFNQGVHTRMLADHTPAPTVCDWNQDSVPDLLIGTMDGHFYYMINNVVTEDEETQGPKNPTEHLVAHWDFEGTGDEVYADKATAGTVADTLTTLNESNVTIADGVASINNNGCLVAADSADLDQTGKMTIFARVKIAAGAYYSLIDKRGVGTGDGIRAYAIALAPGNPAGMNVGFVGNYTGGWLDVGVWREIAMVVDTNESGKLTVELLMSKNTATEDGSDFISVLKATTSQTALNNATAALGIGNTPTEIANRAVLRQFDDVRIFNTALSNNQLAELVSADKGDATSYYLSAIESNLAISFAQTTTSYAVTTTKDTITLTPKTEDVGVTVKVNGTTVASGVANSYPLGVGANTYTITTTNSAGAVQKTYTITITREEVVQPTSTKEDLKIAIDSAKEIEQGKYSNGSWMVLQNAIVSAQNTYDATASTGANYYAAKAVLEDATNKLTTEFTRADLLWLMEEAAADYAEDTQITNLIASAKEVTASSVSSTKELKKAYNNLLAKAMGTTVAQAEVKESIDMKYSATINADLTDTPYMTFNFNGKTSNAIAGVETEAGSNTYTFDCSEIAKIMPQDMAEVITATLTVGKYSKTYEYSVLEYCVDILEASELSDDNGVAYTTEQLAAMKELVVELVQYGKEVQTYRGITGSELLTGKMKGRVADYESYDLADDDASALKTLDAVDEKLTGATSDAYKWKNVTLVLGNKVKIRARFTASDVTNLKVKVSIGGEEKEVAYKQDAEAGVYVLDFDEIYAYEYATPIALKFYEGGTQVGNTLNYSINTYLCEMNDYSGTTAENFTELLLAIHNFGNAAVAYKQASASAAQ